jgi:hypothetical protein
MLRNGRCTSTQTCLISYPRIKRDERLSEGGTQTFIVIIIIPELSSKSKRELVGF